MMTIVALEPMLIPDSTLVVTTELAKSSLAINLIFHPEFCSWRTQTAFYPICLFVHDGRAVQVLGSGESHILHVTEGVHILQFQNTKVQGHNLKCQNISWRLRVRVRELQTGREWKRTSAEYEYIA